MAKQPHDNAPTPQDDSVQGAQTNTFSPDIQYNREPPMSKFDIDLDQANAAWGSHFTSLKEIFSTVTELPDGEVITSATHMLGQDEDSIRLIAYNDDLGVQQSDIGRFIAPGEIAIAIKHHSCSPDPDEKERMKLQCTHIQIAVGVETEDCAGSITINNPQDYQEGLFGDVTYPMIFIKPQFPGQLTAKQQQAYVNNIRTWLVIANTFTEFPGNYNGGDPLATRSVAQIEELGDKLLEALGGEKEAIKWLRDSQHQVYCAELAHVSLNLGIHCPLSEAALGSDRFALLQQQLTTREFLSMNSNRHCQLIPLQAAPDDLKPIAEELGIQTTEPSDQDPFGDGLAIEPFTLADILERFIQETVPREQHGESLAPVQSAILTKALPSLLDITGMSELHATDPKRMAVEALYSELINLVAKEYADYQEFRASLHPLLLKAKTITGPRDDGGGAFVPPHCFLVRATDCIEGRSDHGVLDWQYIGHGLHESVLVERP